MRRSCRRPTPANSAHIISLTTDIWNRQTISVIQPVDLQARASTNIISAIAREPGVSQITSGGAISKPVIRGLGYNRVVVVNDGIRQEGQQWGDEHGIEVDGASVHSVEILKGPASLMYGSDAMAGVLIFHPSPVAAPGTVQGSISTEYQSNNGLVDYSLYASGNHNGLVWDARFSDKYAHAYRNKTNGWVHNSGFRERAASGMLGINRNWGYSRLKLSYYHLTPGIIEGEEYLIPDYRLFDAGVFATASKQLGSWVLSGGLRADVRLLHSLPLEERFQDFSRTFPGISGSIGAVRTIGENVHLRINLSRGFRAQASYGMQVGNNTRWPAVQ